MKRFLIAGIAGVSTFGAVFGFAAAIDVTSDNFGSGDKAVATCDGTAATAAVKTSYTTSYDPIDGRYEVTAVVVDNINSLCDGETVGVTLTKTSGTDDIKIGDGTAVYAATVSSVATNKVSVPMGTDNVSAEEVTGVHVIIRTTGSNSTSAEVNS